MGTQLTLWVKPSDGEEPLCDHCGAALAEYGSETDSGIYCLECLRNNGEDESDYRNLALGRFLERAAWPTSDAGPPGSARRRERTDPLDVGGVAELRRPVGG